MNARHALAATLLAATFALPAAAQDAAAPRALAIYRCTDAAGHVTLQNDVPCPRGSRQERQVVDVPPPLPAYVPREERMPAIVAAERADEAKEIAAAIQPLSAAGEPAGDGAAMMKSVMAQLTRGVISPLPTTLVINSEGKFVGMYAGYSATTHAALANLLMIAGVELAAEDKPATFFPAGSSVRPAAPKS